jgi:hypothetical protein
MSGIEAMKARQESLMGGWDDDVPTEVSAGGAIAPTLRDVLNKPILGRG